VLVAAGNDGQLDQDSQGYTVGKPATCFHLLFGCTFPEHFPTPTHVILQNIYIEANKYIADLSRVIIEQNGFLVLL
jgi:hypothetical protein